MSCAGIVLAAGASTRLGSPKQEVELGGELLLFRSLRIAQEALLAPLFAVVPDVRWNEALERRGVQAVVNEDAAEGMGSSVRCGIQKLLPNSAIHGVLVMTCDQPFVKAVHLRALCADPGRVTASAYAGRRGVPAYFPVASFPALLALTGDAGARDLLQGACAIPDEELAFDIDTEEQLREARHRIR